MLARRLLAARPVPSLWELASAQVDGAGPPHCWRRRQPRRGARKPSGCQAVTRSTAGVCHAPPCPNPAHGLTRGCTPLRACTPAASGSTVTTRSTLTVTRVRCARWACGSSITTPTFACTSTATAAAGGAAARSGARCGNAADVDHFPPRDLMGENRRAFRSELAPRMRFSTGPAERSTVAPRQRRAPLIVPR